MDGWVSVSEAASTPLVDVYAGRDGSDIVGDVTPQS